MIPIRSPRRPSQAYVGLDEHKQPMWQVRLRRGKLKADGNKNTAKWRRRLTWQERYARKNAERRS